MENKNEILSNLYALRAGMSAISQEKDKKLKLDSAIKNSTEENKHAKKEFDKKIAREKNEINEEKAKLQQTEWSIPMFLFLNILLAALVLLAGISIGVFLWGWGVIEPFTDPEFNGFWYPEYFILAPVMFVLGWALYLVVVVLTVASFTIPILYIIWIIRKTEERRDANASIRKDKELAPARIQRKKEKILSFEQAILDSDHQHKQHCLQCKENSSKCVQISRDLHQLLIAEHSTTLDPRDWQHIDLLIFYFETGRADTLKEALQLVDRQIQNDAIIDAINVAGVQIQTSIRTGLQDLQINMVKCFAHISGQLEQISQGVDRVAQGIDAQNAQLSSISRKIDLNNALREKANTNSMQLMQDVNYMRNLAENAEYRRRNNM